MEAQHLIAALHLIRPKGKAGKPPKVRSIPIPEALVQAQRDWLDTAPDNPWGLVFIDAHGRWPRRETTDRDQLRAIQRRANVSRPDGALYTTHELRNTAATRLLELGVAPEVVSQIMGHTRTETTEIYYRQVDPRLLTALTDLAGHYKTGK